MGYGVLGGSGMAGARLGWLCAFWVYGLSWFGSHFFCLVRDRLGSHVTAHRFPVPSNRETLFCFAGGLKGGGTAGMSRHSRGIGENRNFLHFIFGGTGLELRR